jgi:hypothetical protein
MQLGADFAPPTRPGQAQERAKSGNMLYCEQGIELFAPFEGDRSDVSWAARIMLHWENLDEGREPVSESSAATTAIGHSMACTTGRAQICCGR